MRCVNRNIGQLQAIGILDHFRRFRSFSLNQSGMAYMAILILLAILSTLTFSFLFKVGTQTRATMTRGSGMQAAYLAEAAANHAMWRLLNESPSVFSARVSADDDDAEEKDDGNMELDHDALELGKKRFVGLRFLHVAIPQGATIVNAQVTFQASDDDDHDVNLTIYGQDSNSPTLFDDEEDDISDRPKTTASVSWNIVVKWIKNNTYQTPDLSPIIQEMVNRAGWVSGNAIALLFQSDVFDEKRRAVSHDKNTSQAPLLQVEHGDATLAAGDVYYMHSLAGGRYGYKIRYPTDTTFATVATVGAMDDNVVNQSYVLHIPHDPEVCDGLAGYWQLDESSGSTSAWDASGNGNHGQLVDMDPAADWDAGHLEGAVDCDGTNDHLRVPHAPGLSLIDQLTAAAWVYAHPGSLSGYDMVLNKGTEGNNQNFWFGTVGDEITFGFYNGGFREFNTFGENLVTDTWYHIAASFDNAGNMVRVYVNGSEVANWSTDREPLVNTDDLYIGRSQYGEYWDGRLDEVRIYNRALYPAEIARLHALTRGGCGSYANGPPLVDAGPDQTLLLPAVVTSLDGAVADEGLPDPPNTVTTTWTQISGPGTATFDDASLVNTGVQFSTPGTYVLRLTADDGDLTAFDDVTIENRGLLYVEKNETWPATVFSAWQVVDLGGAPFNVPPDAVLEVGIANTANLNDRQGGVRTAGSALGGRRFHLHEAEGGGSDGVVMHVQADSHSRIEYAAEDDFIKFKLLGYWTLGTYVETFHSFSAGASGSWQDHNLDAYGVGPGQVAEIVVVNTASDKEFLAGVRSDGSGLARTVDIHEAEPGGIDACTLLVKTGSAAGAPVQLYAESDAKIDFYLVGYWSTPPATYTESSQILGSPAADATWQDADLSGFGVPGHAVAQITLANTNTGSENHQGVRATGSSLARTVNLHESEGGGSDLATLHVTTDDTATIQWFHQDVSDNHHFHLMGWWH